MKDAIAELYKSRKAIVAFTSIIGAVVVLCCMPGTIVERQTGAASIVAIAWKLIAAIGDEDAAKTAAGMRKGKS